MSETPFMAQRRKLQELKAKQDGVELTSIEHPALAGDQRTDWERRSDEEAEASRPKKKKSKKKSKTGAGST